MTPKISPADLVFIRRALNKSQENAAQMCSTSQVTWSRWERGVTAPIPSNDFYSTEDHGEGIVCERCFSEYVGHKLNADRWVAGL